MPSSDYDRALSEAAAHHARSKTYSGKFLRPHKPFLLDLATKLELRSAIDYGCGKGAQYTWVDPGDGLTLEEALGFPVAKFDPAWPPYAEEPVGPFDLVICTHVLGSIPTGDLPEIIDRLYAFATKAVFIGEKIGAVRKQVFSQPHLQTLEWTEEDWQRAIGKVADAHARSRGIETLLSFRHRDDEEQVHVRRYRWLGAWVYEPEFSS